MMAPRDLQPRRLIRQSSALAFAFRLALIVALSTAAVSLAAQSSSPYPSSPARLTRPLLCRQCGADIVSPNTSLLLTVASPQALTSRNWTVGGLPALLQRFANPAGYEFEVVSMATDGVSVTTAGESVEEGTFFPGFTWQVCGCPKCGGHLGWLFRSVSDSAVAFYGLILDRLLDSGDLGGGVAWVENA